LRCYQLFVSLQYNTVTLGCSSVYNTEPLFVWGHFVLLFVCLQYTTTVCLGSLFFGCSVSFDMNLWNPQTDRILTQAGQAFPTVSQTSLDLRTALQQQQQPSTATVLTAACAIISAATGQFNALSTSTNRLMSLLAYGDILAFLLSDYTSEINRKPHYQNVTHFCELWTYHGGWGVDAAPETTLIKSIIRQKKS